MSGKEDNDLNNMDACRKLDLILERMKITDEKLEGIDGKLTELSTKLITIEGRVKVNENNIVSLQKQSKKDEVRFVNIEQKLNEYKVIINDNKTSCEFTSGKFELLKNTPDEIAAIKNENVKLKKTIDDLKNNLELESIGRNVEQQYHRTSLNIKLCGVPAQPGEDDTRTVSNMITLEVIQHVCSAASILFDTKTVDVCHRLGSSEERASPILIRFRTKWDRFNFFAQKERLKNFTTEDVEFSTLDVEFSTLDPKKKDPPPPPRNGFGGSGNNHASSIYMQEHLTKFNKDLLKSAKMQLKGVGYEFPGYIMQGEVRAKWDKDSKYEPIKCERDIKRLLREAR